LLNGGNVGWGGFTLDQTFGQFLSGGGPWPGLCNFILMTSSLTQVGSEFPLRLGNAASGQAVSV
jgi:hypothetical protein